MARCATCNNTIVLGGVKDSDVRYCSSACRFQDFFPKFEAALARVAAANPNPLPDPAPNSKTNVPEGEETGFSTVGDDGKDLIVILLGWVGSAAVAILVYWLVNLVGYQFHAQTFWFVIPIGAYLCGMVAGCGFWLALRWLNRLPTGWTYLAAGLGGALSYVLIYFLMWWLLEFPGAKVRDEVGFLEFLQFVLEHQRIRLARGKGEGFEVGKWGYPRFAINVLGFVFGVISTVAIGGGKSYCPKCKRYLETVGKQIRSSSDPETTATALHPVIVGVLSGRIQEALDRHAALGVPGGKEYFTTTIAVEACLGCGTHQATLAASVRGDQGVQQIEGFVFQGTTDHPVRLFA